MRASTPWTGDPAAGKVASALCQNCHGEQGKSFYPGWPNLAGQDAQYLASAINAYRDGSRTKTVPCAGCHGEGGVSKRPGIPSLAGREPDYLLPAMKAYVSGERKHAFMKAVLTGAPESELDRFAKHYAGRAATNVQTPPIGDPKAGKAAAEAEAAPAAMAMRASAKVRNFRPWRHRMRNISPMRSAPTRMARAPTRR